MNVLFQFAVLVINMREKMEVSVTPSARLNTRDKGSPRVKGDDEEDDVDDLENEFDHGRGTSKANRQWQGQDVDLSSSSRHESQPIPLLTNGQVSFENHDRQLERRHGMIWHLYISAWHNGVTQRLVCRKPRTSVLTVSLDGTL